MKKKINILLPMLIVGAAIIILGGLGIWRFSSAHQISAKQAAQEVKHPTTKKEKEAKTYVAKTYADTSQNYLKDMPMDMEEQTVQEDIHEMTHQLVYADQKWGVLEITKARIDRLIKVVEFNKKNGKYDEANCNLYLEILKRWQNGDFSHAVQDHNDMWALLGGNVGKATRLLTPSEEKAFIVKNFGN
ncbi:DUF6241 domain-containing protein [Pullulanibacillus sp. KACC 23026]|uniref:DUF6241 domain-containing protein n=1 Tax=Pullulanibacillus sp. KACC 23026 TaxID=3028315 RepID=UPI0023AF8456|nr:DUF6241 domain-containing protein [Pullulanibacillus sp. KACC 23026]WEG12489.1 DUF6241 domain-containing protein [Pullulanibacillus sp. KACC 23026]